MLSVRLLLAAALLAPFVVVIGLDVYSQFQWPWLWLFVAVPVTVLATWELLDLYAAKEWRPIAWPIYAANVAIVSLPYVTLLYDDRQFAVPIGPLGWAAIGLAIGLVVAFAVEMLRFEGPDKSVVHLGLSALAMVYLGLLMSIIAALRLAGGPGSRATGLLLLFAVLFVAKMCDSGGFLIGKPFGRTPLAPLLSPTKSREGAIGGVLFALLAGWLVGTYVQPWLAPAMPAVEWWRWLLFGLLLAVGAMLGDLAESLIKRDMERKDAASWIPAFGGTLDIIDSALFAAPLGYLAWALGLV